MDMDETKVGEVDGHLEKDFELALMHFIERRS
jgi:hypothetical protein